MKPSFRVMIVDVHPLMRCGMRQLLERSPQFDIAAEADSGNDALINASHLPLDMIILGSNLHDISGLDMLTALRRRDSKVKIIVFTDSDNPDDIVKMMGAGANDYLFKDSCPDQLIEQISQVVLGQNKLSDRISDTLNCHEIKSNPMDLLTNREKNVLGEVAKGLSNKQVANQLSISEETVKVHIRNVLRKLGVHSRIAATILFFDHK